MSEKIYVVDLTDEERAKLLDMLKSGTHSARKLNRLHILLLADEGKTDAAIAEALHTGLATVHRVRQRFVEENLEGALHEHARPGGFKRLDLKAEAVLEQLAHSQPPAGRKRWTLHLLADRLVELQMVDRISHETVRQELKKNGLSLASRRNGASPP